MPVALDTSPSALDRMRRSLEALDHPVEFCRRYLRLRGFHHQARDFDDVLAVAVESLVKAGLSWIDRDGDGVAFTTWAYRYMDREVFRELARDRKRAGELTLDPDRISDAWLVYDAATTPFHQVDDRDEIGDLMDRANLSDAHRRILWYAALHGSSDGPPPRGQQPVGRLADNPDFGTAIRRIRKVIAGNTLNDDWAAARARFQAKFEAAAYKHRARRQGTCVMCGEQFEGKRADARYCSEQCKRRAQTAAAGQVESLVEERVARIRAIEDDRRRQIQQRTG
jgi:hypothetical protein